MPPNPTYAYVGAFVEELARAGLAHVCICPGSRSTPLAICFARHPRIKVWMHLDERSAAFFALGLAKATRRAVALVCTSGTAAANFMPAVVEARHGQVPLVVLTADRPPELRDRGAPQTIDQIRFYGAQVKWAVEMADAQAREDVLRYARATACRAVAVAEEAPAGPVHCNFPFREPLVPIPEVLPANLSSTALAGRLDGQPYARVTSLTRAAAGLDSDLPALADDLSRTPNGLIVCGPMDEPDLPGPLADLALRLGYPILADPLSGLRCGPHDLSMVIDAYDAFLRDEAFAQDMVPQVVLRFGAMPTSKPLLHYLQRHPKARQVLVSRNGEWLDPTLLASQMIVADPVQLCTALAEAFSRLAASPEQEQAAFTDDATVPARPRSSSSLPSDRGRRPGTTPFSSESEALAWQCQWIGAQQRTRAALAAELAAIEEPFEGRVFAELAELLPAGATLVAGNSMPVRDLDTFFPAGERRVRILGNRGASGIDGVVSTALGVAAANDGPTVLVIGDISFYHDSNGLLAAKQHNVNLTIVLLNNDGGGIFSFLPQASEDLFETLFGTPHGLDFSHLAALYGARYTRISDWRGFRQAVRAGMEAGGLHIVEVCTDRQRNVALHRRCWPAVSAALRGSRQEVSDGRVQD